MHTCVCVRTRTHNPPDPAPNMVIYIACVLCCLPGPKSSIMNRNVQLQQQPVSWACQGFLKRNKNTGLPFHCIFFGKHKTEETKGYLKKGNMINPFCTNWWFLLPYRIKNYLLVMQPVFSQAWEFNNNVDFEHREGRLLLF